MKESLTHKNHVSQISEKICKFEINNYGFQKCILVNMNKKFRQIQTRDLRFTSIILQQLSYYDNN